MPSFLCLCVSLSSLNLSYLVNLLWITFWNRFYKCLMNWLHDNNSVDLVSIKCGIQCCTSNRPEWTSRCSRSVKGLISSKVPLRLPKTNCCKGQLALQCLSWIFLWIRRLYWISITLCIPRHSMPVWKCFLYVSYIPSTNRIFHN